MDKHPASCTLYNLPLIENLVLVLFVQAMAAINSRKMKYAILRGPFEKDGIKNFLRDLSYGRGSTAPIAGDKLPTIETQDPWDGKDGEVIVFNQHFKRFVQLTSQKFCISKCAFLI